MYNKNGFTIIELIIVIAIIGILSAIAVPNMQNWMANERLREAARVLYNDIQLLKTNAIKENQIWGIEFVPGSSQYLLYSDWNGTKTLQKTVDFTDSSYKSGVNFGYGNATTNAEEGGGTFPDDNVGYHNNELVINSRGMMAVITDVKKSYVYLSNNKGGAYAIGTPTIAGIVYIKRWTGASWK